MWLKILLACGDHYQAVELQVLNVLVACHALSWESPAIHYLYAAANWREYAIQRFENNHSQAASQVCLQCNLALKQMSCNISSFTVDCFTGRSG